MSSQADYLTLTLRTRKHPADNGTTAELEEPSATWDAHKTAIIVCDMWDRHWCAGASGRVDELAPAMNRVLDAVRAQGVLILHAPSDTMPFYEGTPQRQRAKSAPPAEAPAHIHTWQRLDLSKEAPLPIDDSDGGCDDQPYCPIHTPWTRQHPALDIHDTDAISDQGGEVYNLFEQHGIENVIVMGVHTNMCVLGRPFSIRQMVGLGKNVVLLRDMTDAMYNSRRAPYVDHFRGTELVIEHIETYWCPTITSDQLAGGQPFQFRGTQS